MGQLESFAILREAGHHVRQTQRIGTTLCPFHSESTPSFVIFPDGACRCYACGVYLTATKYLFLALHFGVRSGRYGNEQYRAWDAYARGQEFTRDIIAPRWQPKTPPREVRVFLRWSYDWLRAQFRKSPIAQQYWRRRGFTAELDQYIGGYLPDDTDVKYRFVKHLATYGADWRELAVQAGLITPHGGARISNRLLITVPDEEGLPTFYQGRWIPNPYDRKDKFQNPPNWTPPISFLKGSKDCHIIESSPDGLSVHSRGASVLLTWGAGNATRIRAAALRYADCRFFVWEDPDPAGRQFVTTVLDEMEPFPVKPLRAPAGDPNHWLRSDPRAFTNFVAQLSAA